MIFKVIFDFENYSIRNQIGLKEVKKIRQSLKTNIPLDRIKAKFELPAKRQVTYLLSEMEAVESNRFWEKNEIEVLVANEDKNIDVVKENILYDNINHLAIIELSFDMDKVINLWKEKEYPTSLGMFYDIGRI